MTINTYEIKRAWTMGEEVSISKLIKAGIFIETETTKMLTAQLNDTNLTKAERVTTRIRIRKAGYAIEMTGNMDKPRVYEVTA